MLIKIRNYLACRPAIFSFIRKCLELNFVKQKRLVRQVFDCQDKNKKVLDVGCGTGEFAPVFRKLNYQGIDISQDYIKYATKKDKSCFQVMDARNLDFQDETFDYILIMAILHHLSNEDVKKVLVESKRVLKSSGTILVMEDAKISALENGLVRLFQGLDKGENIRQPGEYEDLIRQYFKIIKQKSFRSGVCVYHSFILQK